MKKEEILSLYQDEVQTAVNVTSFMTGVTIFFTGLLITRFDSYDISIKIPILFLILSTFGFLYSTLIYANASGDLARLKAERFHKEMNLGDSIGEYIGVYFLVLSIPLVMNVITNDVFLRVATLVVALGGLFVYHISGFSIMQTHYKRKHHLFLSSIALIEILMFFSQKNISYFVILGVVQIVALLALTFYARKFDRNTI
jgi:hypothetical protein